MRLGIDEVARALGVTPEVIQRWVAQGKIPALVVDRQTVFDRKEIGRWAAERNVSLVDARGTESVVTPQTTSLVEGMRRGGLHKGIAGTTVADVLAAAVDRIALPADVSHDELYRAVLEREQLASTGVGRGVAIPHVRAPLPGYAGPAIVATCLLEDPVEFGAVDGQPVFVLFATVSPSVKTHLELLSQLSYCLRDDAFLTLLRRDPALADLLREAERRIAQLPHPR